MLNQTVLVGRLVANPEIKELENERKESVITIACPRSFKNADGTYDTDFIDVRIYNAIATQTAEWCKKGDIIGIKGRIETFTIESEDGTKKKEMYIIADKITFLSSKKVENEEEQ